MKFFSVIPLLAAAIVAAQDNSFSQPQPGDEIRAGDAYVIRWNATTDGQVQLVLLQGKSDNLSPVLTISDGIDNRGAVRWIVPDSLADGDNYALRINPVGKADDINYTGQFKITGGKAVNTTTEAAASASANATSSASEQTSSASAVVPVTSGANSSTTVPVASTVANTSTEAASTESSTASAVTTSIVGAGVSNGTGNGTIGTSSGASGSASRTTLTGSTSRASGSASRSTGSAAATGSAGASASRAPTNGGVVNSQNLGLVGVAAGIAALMM